VKTEKLTVRRGKTDAMANRVNTTHTVDGFFAWGSGARSSVHFDADYDRRESAAVSTELYVRRGADVRARDRIERFNGEVYSVVGHVLWDQDSPLTGHNFGWAIFNVESVNG
jgi:hypothetical protein